MSEALILLGEYEEALYYINIADSIYKKDAVNMPAYIDTNLFNAMDLYGSIALANSGEINKAVKIYNKIKPEDFYFLSKKYHLILYLMQGRSLRRIKSCTEQLEHLINDTGFKKLTELTWFPFSNEKKVRYIQRPYEQN